MYAYTAYTAVKRSNAMSDVMKDRLEQILNDATAKIQESDALDKLNDVRVSFLGKKRCADSVY